MKISDSIFIIIIIIVIIITIIVIIIIMIIFKTNRQLVTDAIRKALRLRQAAKRNQS